MKAKKLKGMLLYFIPFIGAWYFILSDTFGWPNIPLVSGILFGMDLILVGLYMHPFKQTKDGTLMVDTSNLQKDTYRLSLDTPLEELATKETITLKVDNAADLSHK